MKCVIFVWQVLLTMYTTTAATMVKKLINFDALSATSNFVLAFSELKLLNF